MRRCAAALFLLLLACHGTKEQRTPASLYASGRAAIEHGDYALAERIAHDGQTEFAGDAQSRELFAALEAEAIGRNDAKGALAVLDRTPATGAPLPTVRRLIARAYALDNSRKPKEADATYAAADALAARVAPALRPEIAMRRAAPMFHLRNFAAMAAFARRAAETAKPEQTWVLASAYGSLGLAESNMGQWRQAKEHYAVGVRYAHAAQAKAVEAATAVNLGWVALQLGDVDEALELLRGALILTEQQQMLGPQHVALTNIAEAYESRLEPENALPYATRALAMARKLGAPQAIANSLGQLATINLELGRMDDAISQSSDALSIRQQIGSDVLHSRLLNARIAAASGNPAQALAMLDDVAKSKDADPPMRWRAQAIKAKILAQLGSLRDAEAMYEATLKTGDEAREQVQGPDAFAFERNLLGIYDEYIDLLLQQRRNADALRVAERSRARTLREAIRLDPHANVDPTAIARAKNAIILCYWLGAKRSLLWTVTPHGVDVATLPPGDDVDRAADAYREEIQSPAHSLENSVRGAKLYAMLVEPAKVAAGSRVVILPDGHLNALSFETLIAPSPQRHYWIDDVTVSYSPSLQFLAASPPWQAPREPRLLALGAVPAQGREFPELTRAGEELGMVASHFAHRVVVDKGAATPASYKAAQPEHFDFIHFAAHATASTRAPLESAVILASGRLSGQNIVDIPLSAKLVTVSSCNSAGRRSYAGEGLVGLAWAFLSAGAQRVVAAQWEVVDSATPKIMDGMYGGIARGLDPADALRQAKLSLLHSQSVFRSPSYWAPFAVYGAV